MAESRFDPPAARSAVASRALFRPDNAAEDARPDGVLWLDRGECLDPKLNDLVARLMKELPDHAVFAYPTAGPFYRRLALHLGLAPDRLMLAQGSDGIIKAVFESFVEPGDRVVLPDPTYQMYGVYATMFGARSQFVPYRMIDGRPHLDHREFIQAIATHRPKLVGLPHPDNPTGFVFPLERMQAIIEAAGEAGALILIDEAYYPFHPHTVLPWIEQYGHLVVARTFSKAWGMAGLRLGFAAAQPRLIKTLLKVRLMVEASGVAMGLAERLLDHETEVKESLARLIEGKTYFSSAMAKLGYQIIDTPCNFVHVNFADKRQAVEAALEGIARYRVFPDPLLKDFLRFTTTTPALFERVVEAIGAVSD